MKKSWSTWQRMKYVSVRYFFVKNCIEANEVTVVHKRTNEFIINHYRVKYFARCKTSGSLYSRPRDNICSHSTGVFFILYLCVNIYVLCKISDVYSRYPKPLIMETYTISGHPNTALQMSIFQWVMMIWAMMIEIMTVGKNLNTG